MKYIITCLLGCLLSLTSNSQQWETLASLSGDAPNIPVMASVNGKIYILAGQRYNFPSPTFIYDPSTDTWSDSGTAQPAGTYWSSGVGLNGKIYVMGGGAPYPGQTFNYIYDPATNSWSTGQALMTPRMYHNAVVAGGKIYLIGGQNGDGASEWHFDEYDPALDSWTRKAQLLNNGAWYCGAVNIGDSIYRIAGGGYSASMIKKYVEAYSITSNTWTAYPDFHRGLHAPAAVVVKDHIFLLGGSSNSADMDSVWVYNPKTGKWADAGFRLPSPMSYHKAVVLNDCIYLYKDGSLYKYCPDFSSIANNEIEIAKNSLYPNPNNGNFYIEMENENDFNITITNSLGQSIDHYNYQLSQNQNILHVEMSQNNAAGFYLVTLKTNKEVRTYTLFLRN